MGEDFERLALKRLSYYFGKSQTELKRTFSLESSAKNINEVLLSKMLGIDGKLTSSAELLKSNITPKTIRIQKTGHIKEGMSFPTFKFTEIIQQKWEDSDFYKVLKNSVFMFVIFNENDMGDYIFSRIKFWRMSEKDLLEARNVWEKTAEIIRKGVKLEFDGRVTRNNLPSGSESPVAHVRPHARNAQDTYPLPDGRLMTKQCFWLNRGYIENIVTDAAEKVNSNQKLFSEEEQVYISSLLSSDLIFVSDIEIKYIEKFGKLHIDRVNAKSLKALGYKYYSDYIISMKYENEDEYFSKLILETPILDFSKMDSRLIQSLSFNKMINMMRSTYDVLEFEEGKYLTFDHLRDIEPDISKTTILEFATNAIRYTGKQRYLNSHFLRKEGFQNNLYGFGFSDFFYDRILRYSKVFKFMRIGGTLLFYDSSDSKTNGDFFRDIFKDIKSMDIERFEEYLKDEYGISLSKNRIMTISKANGLYYDFSMEKIYYTKDDFYNELYEVG